MSDWAKWHRELVSRQRAGLLAHVQRLGLTIAALPYAGAMYVRNRLYDTGLMSSYAAAAPVVSVGNLTVGGTGKTPAVAYLARKLRQADVRVAILSRGYGAANGRNDEALVLEENLPDVPHLQGAQRVELAAVAVEELEAELLILDDGFQHRRLRRDFDLVLVDATNPWGYGHLLPRGLLREPLSGLRRASAVLITRCDQVDRQQRLKLRAELERRLPGRPLLESRHAPTGLLNSNGDELRVEDLAGRCVAAFCGLGNPTSFFQTLRAAGAELIAERLYPDHHPYTRTDVEDLRGWAESLPADAWLLTSQKDLVKLRIPRLGNRPLFALRVELEPLTDPSPLLDPLVALVEAHRTKTCLAAA